MTVSPEVGTVTTSIAPPRPYNPGHLRLDQAKVLLGNQVQALEKCQRPVLRRPSLDVLQTRRQHKCVDVVFLFQNNLGPGPDSEGVQLPLAVDVPDGGMVFKELRCYGGRRRPFAQPFDVIENPVLRLHALGAASILPTNTVNGKSVFLGYLKVLRRCHHHPVVLAH